MEETKKISLLLLTGILALAFNIRQASGTIYIRDDGSIEQPYNYIDTNDNITYYFLTDIYDNEIIVQRSGIVIDGNEFTLWGSGRESYEYGILVESDVNNVTIQNTNIDSWWACIYLDGSSSNIIHRNNMKGTNGYCIQLFKSSDNTIYENNIYRPQEYFNNYGICITSDDVNAPSRYNEIYGNNITGSSSGITIAEYSEFNVISGNNLSGNGSCSAVFIINSSHNTVSDNIIWFTTNTGAAVELAGDASYNNISQNSIALNEECGILLGDSSHHNTVSGNNITDNYIGVGLRESSNNNKIFHNDFINNGLQVDLENPSENSWDDGYRSGGNYWSDYDGEDSNGDGIGDTPYVIDVNNTDRYPLMKPRVWGGDIWPMFHRNRTHTGYSTSTAPDTNNLSWIYTTGESVFSSPAVVDGKVYVGSDDCNLYCLPADDPNGDGLIDDTELIWSFTTGGKVFSSPAVGFGSVYVGSEDCNVYRLPLDDPDGNQVIDDSEVIYRYTTGGYVNSSPATSSYESGVFYVGSHDRNVYRLGGAGGQWSFETGGTMLSSPALTSAYPGHLGRVYVGIGRVYCLPVYDPNGDGVIDSNEVIWSFRPANSAVACSPALADDKVYTASLGGEVYCLPQNDPNDDGVIDDSEVIWTFTTDGSVFSSPAVAYGKVYVGSGDHKIYCLPQNDPNGDGVIDGNEVIWSYTTGDAVFSSPAVAGGKVYVASRDGNVYCFGPAASLHLLSPNGREILGGGTDYSIEWETPAGIVSDVLIEYSTNNGSSWMGVDPPNTGNNGTYNWLVPEVASGQCLVRISDAGNPSIFDTSDTVFTILPHPLNLLSPNGSESLVADSNYSIRWESIEGISNVHIEYSTSNGLAWTDVDPDASNTGSYDWLVPQVTSDQCLVRISDANNWTLFDTSDAVFTIFECQKVLDTDLNDDCYVDWSDLVIITDQWLAADCCEPDWCRGADSDEDKDVDFLDFSIFAGWWLECGNPLDPACECAQEVPWQECWNCRTQCHGDANCDWFVNVTDFMILTNAWETRYPEPEYDPRADFNRDGAVDYYDQQILEEWWASSPPADCPTQP